MISLREFTDDEFESEGGDNAQSSDHACHDNDALPVAVFEAQKLRHAVFNRLQVCNHLAVYLAVCLPLVPAKCFEPVD